MIDDLTKFVKNQIKELETMQSEFKMYSYDVGQLIILKEVEKLLP